MAPGDRVAWLWTPPVYIDINLYWRSDGGVVREREFASGIRIQGKGNGTMVEMEPGPEAVSEDAWAHARAVLLAEEKALTRAQDRVAAARRRLPRHQVEDYYRFETPMGEASLSDLFDGRDQLIVYHHMLRPSDPDPCSGCGMFADRLPHLAHLHARNTSFVMVSKAPLAEIEAFKTRMGWTMPWVETRDDFNADFGVTEGFSLNVFLREGGMIWRT